MKINKCVVYIATLNPMTRINYAVVEGVRRVPVSLPRLKCLDSIEPVKYHPYKEEEPPLNAKGEIEKGPDVLTFREKKALEMYKAGVKIKDIAHEFHASNEATRSMIRRAKAKVGEPKNEQ